MAPRVSNSRINLWSEPIEAVMARGNGMMRVLKRISNYLFSHYAEHVFGAHIPMGKWEEPGSHVEAIESVENLERVIPELPGEWVDDRLRGALGSGKVLLLLRDSPQGAERGKVIGLAVSERGGVLYTLGRRVNLSQKWLLTHVVMVRPEYRGQRKAFELTKVRARYGHRRGIVLFCGTIDSRNVVSVRAHTRTNYNRLIVTVHQIALLGGKVRWTTPVRRIRDGLEKLAQEANAAPVFANETSRRPSL